MSEITVYTTGPSCAKCSLTKKALDAAGITYEEVRLDLDPAAAAAIKAEVLGAADGRLVAPVVRDGLTGDLWSDFRRDRIAAAVDARSGELVPA